MATTPGQQIQRWPFQTSGGRPASPQQQTGVITTPIPGGSGTLGEGLGNLIRTGLAVYDQIYGQGAANRAQALANAQLLEEQRQMALENNRNEQFEKDFQRRAVEASGQPWGPQVAQAYAGTRADMEAGRRLPVPPPGKVPGVPGYYGTGAPGGQGIRPGRSETVLLRPEIPTPEPQAGPVTEETPQGPVVSAPQIAPPNLLARPYAVIPESLERDKLRAQQSYGRALATQPESPARTRAAQAAIQGPQVPLAGNVTGDIKQQAEAATSAIQEQENATKMAQADLTRYYMNLYTKTNDRRWLHMALAHQVGGPERLAQIAQDNQKQMLDNLKDVTTLMAALDAAEKQNDRAKAEQILDRIRGYYIANSRLSEPAFPPDPNDPNVSQGEPLVDFNVNVLVSKYGGIKSGIEHRVIKVPRSVSQAFIDGRLNPNKPADLQDIAIMQLGIPAGAGAQITPDQFTKLQEHIRTIPGASIETQNRAIDSLKKQTAGYSPEAEAAATKPPPSYQEPPPGAGWEGTKKYFTEDIPKALAPVLPAPKGGYPGTPSPEELLQRAAPQGTPAPAPAPAPAPGRGTTGTAPPTIPSSQAAPSAGSVADVGRTILRSVPQPTSVTTPQAPIPPGLQGQPAGSIADVGRTMAAPFQRLYGYFSRPGTSNIPQSPQTGPGPAIGGGYWDVLNPRPGQGTNVPIQQQGTIPSDIKPTSSPVYRRENHERLAPIITQAAQAAGVSDLDLFNKMLYRESKFDRNAMSTVGAVGIGQLKPEAARSVGLRVDDQVDERWDEVKNIQGSAAYLAKLLAQFNGNKTLALAAYFGGPSATEWGPKTVAYVAELTGNDPTQVDAYLSAWRRSPWKKALP